MAAVTQGLRRCARDGLIKDFCARVRHDNAYIHIGLIILN